MIPSMKIKLKLNNPNKQSGQGITEYALILTLIALVSVIGLSVLATGAKKSYEDVLAASNVSTPGPNDPKEYCKADMTGVEDWDLQGNRSKSWMSNDGKLCMKNDGGNNYAYNNCSRDSMPTNNDYVVRLDGANLISGNGYGIMLRMQDYSDKPNGYSFQYDPGKGYLVFKKWENGKESDIAKARPPGHPKFDWHDVPRDVVVEMKGTTMSAYVDGELVLAAVDDTYTSGGAGLRTWYSSNVCFDNFKIGQAP